MNTKQIGDHGEAIAAAYLERKGYTILERQYRFQRAEVDLICFQPTVEYSEGGELVFVEVKTRTSIQYGLPEEAITEAKKRNMMRAAEAYIHETRLEGSPGRFDVIAVFLGHGEPQIRHFENAFWIFGF